MSPLSLNKIKNARRRPDLESRRLKNETIARMRARVGEKLRRVRSERIAAEMRLRP